MTNTASTNTAPDPAPVRWTVDARGVATVTLARPERNNAYNGALVDGLHAALDALGTASGLRAVVIEGEGRHFQAGADLTWLNSVRSGTHADNVAASEATARAVDRLNHAPVPTIAKVHGACIGGGTGLISACDVVVAAQSSIFAISEIRWGLHASVIVPHLVDAIGVRQVRRFALTGERFPAEEALRIGLVHQVVPDGELDAACAEIVDAVLAGAPDAIRETKAAILAEARGDLGPQALSRLIESHARKRQSDEAGEGLNAFKDKRPAAWAGGASD